MALRVGEEVRDRLLVIRVSSDWIAMIGVREGGQTTVVDVDVDVLVE